jgi:predicted nucleotidyltransferase
MAEVRDFCRRWRIRELAVFGSALRDDFRSDSDVDILVEFAADADWGLLDHVRMQEHLQRLLDRRVDLVTKRSVQGSANWLRRGEILDTARVVYSEAETVHAAR